MDCHLLGMHQTKLACVNIQHHIVQLVEMNCDKLNYAIRFLVFQLAKELQVPFFETSAKNDDNITQVSSAYDTNNG